MQLVDSSADPGPPAAREFPFDRFPPLRNESFPPATVALMGLFVAIYALMTFVPPLEGAMPEQVWGIQLIRFGALQPDGVLFGGQWYRLFSAVLLHGSLVHLFVNCLCLCIAGTMLEPTVGRGWFLTTFVVAAVAGAVATLSTVARGTIGLGASGGLTGLAAMLFVVAANARDPAAQTRAIKRASGILISALGPAAVAWLSGIRESGASYDGLQIKVDYAAHIGGAIAGLAIGIAFMKLRATEAGFVRSLRPVLRISLAGLAMMVGSVAYSFASGAVGVQQANCPGMIPLDKVPTTIAEFVAASGALAEAYPEDPRPRYLMALGESSKGERDAARADLEKAISLRNFNHCIAPSVQTMLRARLAELSLMPAAPALAPTPDVAQPPSVSRTTPFGSKRSCKEFPPEQRARLLVNRQCT